ncbi:MAG: M14 family zinc carboxypeptidase [Planctomycetota bacterium]|jgi:protein MpaA
MEIGYNNLCANKLCIYGIILGLFVVSGCREASLTSRIDYVERPEHHSNVVKEIVIGKSVLGSQITCKMFGRGANAILIIATIHGNESAGTPLVNRLGGYLANHPELLNNRRVLIIPVANPDGLARRTRHNINGIDLNRNFPGTNFSRSRRHGNFPLSEPESKAIHNIIQNYSPSCIVSIHQPRRCVDYDGPAQALAEAMAKYCDLPVRRVGSRSGSLGSYAGLDLNIPIITVELPGSASSLGKEGLWQTYGGMLLGAVCYPFSPPEHLKIRPHGQ